MACFFFFSSSSYSFPERGFCLFLEREQQTGFLDGFAFYSIVLMEVSLSLTSFPFFSSLFVRKETLLQNETKNSSTFTFLPFSFTTILFHHFILLVGR